MGSMVHERVSGLVEAQRGLAKYPARSPACALYHACMCSVVSVNMERSSKSAFAK